MGFNPKRFNQIWFIQLYNCYIISTKIKIVSRKLNTYIYIILYEFMIVHHFCCKTVLHVGSQLQCYEFRLMTRVNKCQIAAYTNVNVINTSALQLL